MTQYKTQYGTIFAVKEHNGAPAIMCRAEVSETWSLSSMITPFTPGAWTAEELQGQLDNWAATKGWQPVEAPASAEPPEIVDEGSEPDEECPYLQPLENSKKYSCQCALCGDKFVNREICNKSFRGCGWYLDRQDKEAQTEDGEEDTTVTDSCQCRTCKNESCFAHGCTKECPANAGESCLTTSCPEYSEKGQNSADADGFPGWVRPMVEAFLQFPFFRELPAFTAFAIRHSEPVQHHQGGTLADGLYDTSPSKGIIFTGFHGEEGEEREAGYTWADFVRRCKVEGLAPEPLHQNKEETPCNTEPNAPTGAAAATTDGRAAPEPSQAAETTTTSASGADANNSPDVLTAPQPTEGCADIAANVSSSLPTFDYSGLDNQTVADLHLAEREVAGGRRMAEIGLRRMADGVAIAHDALCVTDATNCRNGDGTFSAPEKTFGLWCDSVGLNRKAAERLLQVSKLFDNSTPREQKVLEELGPSLLYAAAKPSAPAELVQAVKDGDITTHKQYQDLLARYNAEHAAREQAEQQRDEAVTHIQAARDMQIDTARERDAALRRAAEAEKQRDGAREALTASKLRGDKLKAENEALKAQPVEAQVVDEEEVNRRAQARADELTAPLREELEALRARHPTDLEEAEQAIRDAYDSAIYTGRVMENAWHTLRPLLPRMDAHRRELAINQVSKTLSQIQGEIAACL